MSIFALARPEKRQKKIYDMKKTITLLFTILSTLSLSAQDLYHITATDHTGKEVSLADYKGKVLLIVNTATRCGYTPQYKELETLYRKYHDRGLEILDFPCNQFGSQAPGTIGEIHRFCTLNYDIHFTQFDKIQVNGPEAHPLYVWLKNGKDIKWNFTKFLVSPDGKILHRYEPGDPVSDIDAAIQAQLR